MKFSVGDLVWAQPDGSKEEEPGSVVQLDCAYSDNNDEEEELSDGIMVKFQVSNTKVVLPPNAVRPFDTNADKRRSTRSRSPKLSPAAAGGSRSMVTPSPPTIAMDTAAVTTNKKRAARSSSRSNKKTKTQKTPKYPQGTTFMKSFGEHGNFQATVDSFDAETGLYRLSYDDGDQEDMTERQITVWINKDIPQTKKEEEKKEEDEVEDMEEEKKEEDMEEEEDVGVKSPYFDKTKEEHATPQDSSPAASDQDQTEAEMVAAAVQQSLDENGKDNNNNNKKDKDGSDMEDDDVPVASLKDAKKPTAETKKVAAKKKAPAKKAPAKKAPAKKAPAKKAPAKKNDAKLDGAKIVYPVHKRKKTATKVEVSLAQIDNDGYDSAEDDDYDPAKPGSDVDDEDRPYLADYAPSGRATCRRCDETIAKGELRLSHVPLFRGKPGFRCYRHLHCMVFSEDIVRVEQIGGWRDIRRHSREDFERLVLRIEESKIEAEEEEKELQPDELVQVTFQGETRAPPKGLTANLLPFQTEGVSWMYHQETKIPELHGGILADEMGMGKTLQTITTMLDNCPMLQHSLPGAKHPPTITGEALEARKAESDLWDKSVQEWHHEMEMNNVPKKMWPKKFKAARAGTMVVCPVIALLQWKTELEKFTEPDTFSIAIYHGPNRAKDFPIQKLCKYDVVLTTYQVLEQDFRKMVSPNKVTCPNCGSKFKIDKLRIHLKYFCGDGAQRTEKQMRQQRTAERHSNRGRGASGGGGQSKSQKKKSFSKTSNEKKKSFTKGTDKKKSFAKVESDDDEDMPEPTPTGGRRSRSAPKRTKEVVGAKQKKKFKGGKRGQPIRPSNDNESESEGDEDMPETTPAAGRPSRSAAVNASKRMSASMNDWTAADAEEDDEETSAPDDNNDDEDEDNAMSYDEEDSEGEAVPAKKVPAKKKAPPKTKPRAQPKKKGQPKKKVESDSDGSDDSNDESSSSEEESLALIRARKKQAEALKRAKKGNRGKGKDSKKPPMTKPPLKGSKSAKGKAKGKGKKKFDDEYSTESDSSEEEEEERGDPLEAIDLDALMQEAMEGSLMSLLHSLCWWRIVLDEAHMIKSRSSQTAAAAFALVGINRWALSGTPLQNRVGELYSLIRFIRIDPMAHYFCRSKDCGCKSIHYRIKDGMCQDCGHRGFQHYSHFNKHVLNPIQRDGYSGDGRRAMFKLKNEVLDKCLLRRTKETRAEDMNLPPRIVTIRTINLHPIEKDFYDALYTQTKSAFSDYVAQGTLLNNYAHIFDLLTRMRQAVDHPYLIVYSKRNCERASNSGDSSQPLVANGSTDCDICHELPTGRVVSTCCGAAFCRSCVLEYVSTAVGGTDDETPCPSCRAGFSIDLNQADQDIQENAAATRSKEPSGGTKKAKESSASTTELGPSLKDLRHVNTGSVLRRINLAEFATSTKIEALVQELVQMRKARPGSKALVFSQFVNMLDLIRWRLHTDPCLAEMGLGVRILHGSMDVKARDAALRDFREDGSVRVLLMSLKSGGVALNLTVASEVFLVDNWWNPAAEMQAIDRTHRLGQHRCIRAVRFIAEGTVEERVLQLQEKKRLVFDGTVGRDAGSLKMLTAEDMKCLFA
ncbi:regulator of chromatin subfamily A member 3-like 1 [Seminavis robusta]|uniref:Regulator of chromatin subfamily A member 3-like 1 n=1 Tax=Seminavis robusta TaxID=568900 RepID=A0A9N8H153_9STRA|nr:regulator of chromatin subfamily A member 3-like 1 [Seminavis robusta]|eukprot:Sro11_g008610.1 regulator of chromatin subfamily A member 3-like 1 (1601) ;mRNA; r:97069-102632